MNEAAPRPPSLRRRAQLELGRLRACLRAQDAELRALCDGAGLSPVDLEDALRALESACASGRVPAERSLAARRLEGGPR